MQQEKHRQSPKIKKNRLMEKNHLTNRIKRNGDKPEAAILTTAQGSNYQEQIEQLSSNWKKK